jgi:transposase
MAWSPYDNFLAAQHQQCLAHLLRRCDELLETGTRGAVRFPRRISTLLHQALDLRDRHDEG